MWKLFFVGKKLRITLRLPSSLDDKPGNAEDQPAGARGPGSGTSKPAVIVRTAEVQKGAGRVRNELGVDVVPSDDNPIHVDHSNCYLVIIGGRGKKEGEEEGEEQGQSKITKNLRVRDHEERIRLRRAVAENDMTRDRPQAALEDITKMCTVMTVMTACDQLPIRGLKTDVDKHGLHIATTCHINTRQHH